MEDRPPEPTLTLSFLKGDLRKEFNHLFLECVRTRDKGMEFFMDHGRALANLREFLQEHAEEKLETGFTIVCEKLETSPGEARKRISLSYTWDAIRQYLDDKGSSIKMPTRVSHIDTLHAIEDIAQRPLAWERMYNEATTKQIAITAQWMDEWIGRYKPIALPSNIPAGLEDDEIEGDAPGQQPERLRRTLFHAEQFVWKMRRDAEGTEEPVVSSLQGSLHESVEEDSSADLPAAFENELSIIRTCLPKARQADPRALYDLWIQRYADAPSELSEASESDLVMPGASSTPTQDKPTPGTGPGFKHPPAINKVIDRIAKLCGGDQPHEVEQWHKLLNDPIKIKFLDLSDWDRHSDEDVRRIGRLIHGNFDKGLRDAIRIVERRIDLRTPLSFLIQQCMANGGRWEHIEGEFRVTVTEIRR